MTTEPKSPEDVLQGPEVDRQQAAEQLGTPRRDDDRPEDLPQDERDEAGDGLIVNEQGEAPSG